MKVLWWVIGVALGAPLLLASCSTTRMDPAPSFEKRRAGIPTGPPSHESIGRGIAQQCKGVAEETICVNQRWLEVAEQQRQQLTLNECAVARPSRRRPEDDSAECKAAHPRQFICRTFLGTTTCTLAPKTTGKEP